MIHILFMLYVVINICPPQCSCEKGVTVCSSWGDDGELYGGKK